MRTIREHICSKAFWFLMGLHILNFSVDPPDLYPDYIPEDLNYNEMESIVEILLEQVLGMEDAIPEHDEDDSSRGLLVNGAHVLFYQPDECFKLVNVDIALLNKTIFNYNPYVEQFRPEIIPPPPKI